MVNFKIQALIFFILGVFLIIYSLIIELHDQSVNFRIETFVIGVALIIISYKLKKTK